jgi:hypothetical protein
VVARARAGELSSLVLQARRTVTCLISMRCGYGSIGPAELRAGPWSSSSSESPCSGGSRHAGTGGTIVDLHRPGPSRTASCATAGMHAGVADSPAQAGRLVHPAGRPSPSPASRAQARWRRLPRDRHHQRPSPQPRAGQLWQTSVWRGPARCDRLPRCRVDRRYSCCMGPAHLAPCGGAGAIPKPI